MKSASSHASLGRYGKVCFARDLEAASKTPTDPQARRVGVAYRHTVSLVVPAEGEDELADARLVGMRRVEPIVKSGAAGEVAVRAENVRTRRQLRLNLERAVVKVNDGQDSQLNVRKLDG